MKRVVGALFMLSAGLCGKHAHGQSVSGAPPPTAQFPPAEPVPAPGAPQGSDSAPPAPPAAKPPLAPAPPPAPAPTPVQAPYAAYAYPPAYYPYPALVPTTTPPNDSDEVVSITISPLHLVFPIVQLTGEVRATPHLGVSLIAGYGSILADSTSADGTENIKVTAYEIGGRVAGYPLKKFKSLLFGAQLMYLKVETGSPIVDNGVSVSGTGAGVAFGPFAGYKLVTSAGFTFLAELGFQYLSAQAEAHDTNGNSDSANDNRFLPLLNLDLGWSF